VTAVPGGEAVTPCVRRATAGVLVSVSGRFFRAIDASHRDRVLEGSSIPGRYGPALYLSASRDGVATAMQAHTRPGTPPRVVVALDVEAGDIFDLRDAAACRATGVRPEDAAAPWQEVVSAGGVPPSWRVADRIRAAGACGLIDPSRTAPGPWHLALWRWNEAGAPRVSVAP
jgi:RES domain-containing protein